MFFVYLINSILTIELALGFFGLYNIMKKGIIVGLIGGLADYIIKDIAVPYFGLFEGFHFITSLLVLSISCYYLIGLRWGAAISGAILSHIISAIYEIVIVLILMQFFGKGIIESIRNDDLMLLGLGTLILIPMGITLYYLINKKVELIKIRLLR